MLKYAKIWLNKFELKGKMGLYPTKLKILPVIAVLKLIRCQWQLNENEEIK